MQLVPSGILVQPKAITTFPDGQITHEPIEEGEVILQTEVGSLKAREHYDMHQSVEHGNRVTHLVNRTVIDGEVRVPVGVSLFHIHETVRTVLDDICAVLSLCYRTPVNYYEIRYRPEDGVDGVVHESFLRRRLKRVIREEGADELINFRDLRNGGLNDLYQAFKTSAHRDTIARVLGFLASSHDSEAIEESYFLAFAALEATISAAADVQSAYTLTSSPFRRLCKRLRKTISEFLAEISATSRIELINDKLPELQRVSTKHRIDQVVQTFQVATADLWVKKGFAVGMARATTNRNILVHEAVVAPTEQLLRDRVRLWVLVERVILRLLAWPDEKIWRWYSQPLRWVNRVEEHAEN